MAKSIGGYVGIGNPILAPDQVFASPSNTVAADASATFTFSAPDNEGLTSVTLYVIVAITSGAVAAAAVGASSPITVTGLTNGTAYTFVIFAINDFGLSPGSFASSAITPTASRGIFSGGQYTDGQGSDAWANNMDYVSVATTGNAVDFGDLTTARNGAAVNCSLTRWVAAGGMVGGSGSFGTGTNVIDYVTIASTGDAADFGDCANGAIPNFTGDVANKTRGMQAGGEAQPSSNKDHVSYITIASTGNTTDFGNLVGGRTDGMCGGCSSTRGIFGGGVSPSIEETIDYFTIASTGNATDFGNLTNVKGERTCGTSSSTRMVMQFREFIEYLTIASTGNTTDFGDPTIRRYKADTASNNVRALFAAGAGDATRSNTPNVHNVIDYVTIASTGDATDFGDLVVAVQSTSGGSNNNGGHQG